MAGEVGTRCLSSDVTGDPDTRAGGNTRAGAGIRVSSGQVIISETSVVVFNASLSVIVVGKIIVRYYSEMRLCWSSVASG